MQLTRETILAYNTAGPRYTSYPTAPEWTQEISPELYATKLAQCAAQRKPLSLYIHIPFCESLCYYCACNVSIRKQHDKYGDEYLDYLFKEVDLVAAQFPTPPRVVQFHLGGGTPTYLNPKQLQRLMEKMDALFDIDREGELAIEIDPRTIDEAKLLLLKSFGFNRISMGIQDFSEEVQEQVNRLQPYDQVARYYTRCRELGFSSINFDLIYGLPKQTLENFSDTIAKVCALRPDRIALYSYANVPWLKSQQKKFAEFLPSPTDKIDLFLMAREALLANGYDAIAMDHFALKSDSMAAAYREGTLHRNFMGYTTKPAEDFIGFGVSAIGFVESTFIQNHRDLTSYYGALSGNALPLHRGKELSRDDLMRQWIISTFMCRFAVDKDEFASRFGEDFNTYFSEEQNYLARAAKDGLLEERGTVLRATELGRLFVRNICIGFDWYFRQKDGHKLFSQTV